MVRTGVSGRVKAVVFDVGNTLWFEAWALSEAEFAELQAERIRPVVANWGIALHEPIEAIQREIWAAYLAAASIEQLRGTHRDPSLPFLIRGALAVRDVEITPEQAEEWWRASWVHERLLGNQLYPDAIDVLRELKAKGMLIGVNTNRPCTAEMHAPGLHDIGIGQFVDAIVCSGDTGYYKPHHSTFDLILERLGVPAGRAVMVGDTCEGDMLGGREAGMLTVWKLNGRYGMPPCPHADYQIHDLAEMLSLPLFGGPARARVAESPTPHEDENEDRY